LEPWFLLKGILHAHIHLIASQFPIIHMLHTSDNFLSALDSLNYMLSIGVSVNERNERGSNPLHYCAYANLLDSAQVILQAEGGKQLINEKDNLGWTPLHILVMHASKLSGFDKSLMELLVTEGADVNATNVNGKLP
jgi:ankyrin repeat protein